MTTYRERREARADRLRGWADGREVKAEAAYASGRQMLDAIPFGQPILVDHYSAGRDTRYRARAVGKLDRSFADQRKADEMRVRADNIDAAAAHAIYSDDADAADRLRERIAGLEAERARLKAYNASCRKGARDLSLLDEQQRGDLMSIANHCPYQLGKNGEMPAYVASNLSGNIGRLRKRLEGLS